MGVSSTFSCDKVTYANNISNILEDEETKGKLMSGRMLVVLGLPELASTVNTGV